MDMPVYAAVHNTQLFSIKTSFLSESHNASAPILDLFSLPPLLISVRGPPCSLNLYSPCHVLLSPIMWNSRGTCFCGEKGFDDG